MADEGLKLLGYWASPYALRVHWALKQKGIEYEYQEEDLPNKSSLLLQYNPVHKKIPVLVHNGKPVAESLIILEYIEETWKQNPLLPEDPYERANARFWANFVEDKCMPAILGTFSKVGEEQQKLAKEARDNLKLLEGELHKKCSAGDTKIGFMDVASAWIVYWAQIVEEIVDIKLIDVEEMPSLAAWFQNVLEAAPVLKECTPLVRSRCTFNRSLPQCNHTSSRRLGNHHHITNKLQNVLLSCKQHDCGYIDSMRKARAEDRSPAIYVNSIFLHHFKNVLRTSFSGGLHSKQ